MIMVMVKFSVTTNGLADEDVYVVGNCAELGEWNHENAVRLTRYDQTDESSERLVSGNRNTHNLCHLPLFTSEILP